MSAFVNTPIGPVMQRLADAAIGIAIWLFMSMLVASKARTALVWDEAAWLCAPLLVAALCIRHRKDGKLSHRRESQDDHAALGLCILGIILGFATPLSGATGPGALFCVASSMSFGFAKLSKHWGMDDAAQGLLWRACLNNSKDKTLRAISFGANPLVKNARGICPLEHCCQSGNADMATLMLRASEKTSTHAESIENAMATAIDSKHTELATMLQGRLPDSWAPPNNRRWRQTIDSIRWRDPSWLQSWLAHIHARNEKANLSRDLIIHDSPPPPRRQRKSL